MAEVIDLHPAPDWATPTTAVVSVFARDGHPVLLTRHILSSVGGQVILNNGARFDCQRGIAPRRQVRFPGGVATVRLFLPGDPLADIERAKIEQAINFSVAGAAALAIHADPSNAAAADALRAGVEAWAGSALRPAAR
ncbi:MULTISPECIES: hypothetical protein [Branchiibius]|uniref:Uncharacterized protein n=1 Tax=Branchiibius cervicis TaxID=908252 RepID=A0ABW2ATI3_9MICO|nr:MULTISPECIES: hypothetical protein [Branchiibius]KYH44769.1 hypothetical protein AZH51_12140 [Branchiibius sp. NY16-3462-2]